MKSKRQLFSLAPLVAGALFTAWIVQERRNPRPMSPLWSFTLKGKARIERVPQTLEEIGVKPGLKVLEIGCGPGVVLEQAAALVQPDGELHAIDIQAKMIESAQSRLTSSGIQGVRLTRADATAIPYEDETFDLVYMVTVIGELPDIPAALTEIRRIIKPGGTFAVTEEIFDPHYTSPGRVQRLCESAGFRHDSTIGGRIQQTTRVRV